MRTLPLLLLASCAAPHAAPWQGAEQLSHDAFKALRPAVRAATVAGHIPNRGRARVLHGPSACRSAIRGQGNPTVRVTDHFPTAGRIWTCSWTVNPTRPLEVDRPALLLVGFEEADPLDLSALGYPGCMLHVPSNPRKLMTLSPVSGSSLLQQQNGVVTLQWPIPAEFAGGRLYLQLAVYSPGANAQGFLLSPGLEVWIGG